MKTLPILSIVAIAALTSCSSVVSKSDYPVTIKSATSQKNVKVYDLDKNLVHSAKTPTTVVLPASEGFFKASKYTVESSTGDKQIFRSKMDPWFVGNLVTGGVVGAAIDGATGAMWKLEDEVIVK